MQGFSEQSYLRRSGGPVKFWDSSAIAPLLMDEEDSALWEDNLREDSELLVWYGTIVELESAINRRKREGVLTSDQETHARRRLQRLEASWLEVQPTVTVRDRALRLLRVHPLRAADAFQLAAALVTCGEQTRGFVFLTNDTRLREAVIAEGFSVD